MLHSLRFRLLLTLIGVVLVAVGTVALFASRATSQELKRYVELDFERNQHLVSSVMSYYSQHIGSDDPQALAQKLAQTADERIILTDGSGTVRADSAEQLVGQSLSCDKPLPAVIVTIGDPFCGFAPAKSAVKFTDAPAPADAETGDVLFFGFSAAAEPATLPFSATQATARAPGLMIRRTQGQELDPIQAGFLGAVNSALIWSVLAAGIAALLLTLVLSRRILGPIDALTAAARVLGQGDLTQRVHVSSSDEIGELARAFNAMADGLARQEQLRRGMVTDVAHELRTPLTNIRGYLEALRDGIARPSPALLASLHDEALLLNRLVDDLQDLALAEAGQLRLDRRPIVLTELVAQAVNALQSAADAKGLRITTELAHSLPPVEADPERIGQILRNLLSNALIHTPRGGSITVKAEFIANWRLEIGDSGARQSPTCNLQSAIMVRVRDTGSGIAPEHLANIFERFYRADRARSRATGGAGLGLAIVKQLVAAHGGRVWAESEPGAGAQFTFTLPVTVL
jgi:signal transduction histidine kinase